MEGFALAPSEDEVHAQRGQCAVAQASVQAAELVTEVIQRLRGGELDRREGGPQAYPVDRRRSQQPGQDQTPQPPAPQGGKPERQTVVAGQLAAQVVGGGALTAEQSGRAGLHRQPRFAAQPGGADKDFGAKLQAGDWQQGRPRQECCQGQEERTVEFQPAAVFGVAAE